MSTLANSVFVFKRVLLFLHQNIQVNKVTIYLQNNYISTILILVVFFFK